MEYAKWPGTKSPGYSRDTGTHRVHLLHTPKLKHTRHTEEHKHPNTHSMGSLGHHLYASALFEPCPRPQSLFEV